MRTRISRRSDQLVAERAEPSPYRAPFHWDLTERGPRLRLDCHGDDEVVLPVAPTLVTGGTASGTTATLDAIARRASSRGWAVAPARAHHGTALRPLVFAALEAAVDAIVGDHPGEPGSDRLRFVLDAFRETASVDDVAYAPVLGALVAMATPTRRGILLLVDALHAATRAESEALLAGAAAVASANPSMRVVVSASAESSVALEAETRSRWACVPLKLDRRALDELNAVIGDRYERRFDDLALADLLRTHAGVTGAVLAHMAVTWESTVTSVITRAQVIEARDAFELARAAELRAAWASELTIGQRRYLQAIAALGANGGALGTIADRLEHDARFGLSGGMLDAVLTGLVHRGVVVVRDGVASIAVPGLASIL